MNLENFHTFLNEPANLHRVSYSELKSLVAEYPYSANLRILLLLKSKLEKNPDLAHNLKLAAAYSPNRSVLYQVMHDPKLMQAIQEEAVEQEEVLELMDLSEVQSLLEREEKVAVENEKAMERTIPVADILKATSSNNWTDGIFEDEKEPASSLAGPAVISIDSLLGSIEDEPESSNIFEDDFKVETQKEEEHFEPEEIAAAHKMLINFNAINLSGYAKVLSEFELTSDDLPLEIELPVEPEIQVPITPKAIKPQPKDSFTSWMAQIERDLNRELEVPDINKNLEILEAGKVSETSEQAVDTPVKEATPIVENAVESLELLEPQVETEELAATTNFIESFKEKIEVSEEILIEKEEEQLEDPKIEVTIPEEPKEKTEEELDAEEEKATKKRVKEIAKKSLSLNNEIVSETLAKLLVQQERYDKAIDMYQKLILKFPELKPMFSEEIERVRKLK